MHARLLQSNDYDAETRREFTTLIVRLFELWQLTPDQKALLLGLSPKTRSTVLNYKNGIHPIANNRDLIDRVGHLLAIHKALKILLPENKELAYQWPTTKNKFFENRTPVEVITDEGFQGLLKVRAYIENQLV